MLHSIKFKFFAAIFAIAVAFIGILSALNLTLYDRYYTWQRQRALTKIYQSMSSSYNHTDMDDLINTILYWEDMEGVRVSIIDEQGNINYDSVVREQLIGPNRAPENLFYGVTIAQNALRVVNMDAVDQYGMDFVNVIDERRDEEFLCLVGLLSQNGAFLVVRIPFTYMQQNSSFNMVFLLISGGVTLVVCIFLALLISRRFTKPLLAIGDVADAIAHLDFSKHYEGAVHDELGQLGHTVNQLSAHLEQTIAELRDSNEQLALEIHEKEKIDALRREFIINVSHELKTPIALIQGYAEGLREGIAETPEDRDYYCDTITDEAARMNRLVMQLLSLSKLELGRDVPSIIEVALDELISDAVHKISVLTEGRSLTIDWHPCGLYVHTDYAMLEQVINNYLTNAIRYTRDNGKIEITAIEKNGGIQLTVMNEGDGVSPEDLPRLWDKFYRTDKARSRESGGTGVGLSIVRATADVLGGACGARNVPGGIEFWFFIPNRV